MNRRKELLFEYSRNVNRRSVYEYAAPAPLVPIDEARLVGGNYEFEIKLQKLGAAYRRQGDLATAVLHDSEAIKLFETRLAAGADEAFTRYYIAALYALRGDAAAARQHLERPLKDVPAFTRWRLPRDPDFDGVRAELGVDLAG